MPLGWGQIGLALISTFDITGRDMNWWGYGEALLVEFGGTRYHLTRRGNAP